MERDLNEQIMMEEFIQSKFKLEDFDEHLFWRFARKKHNLHLLRRVRIINLKCITVNVRCINIINSYIFNVPS